MFFYACIHLHKNYFGPFSFLIAVFGCTKRTYQFNGWLCIFFSFLSNFLFKVLRLKPCIILIVFSLISRNPLEMEKKKKIEVFFYLTIIYILFPLWSAASKRKWVCLSPSYKSAFLQSHFLGFSLSALRKMKTNKS